MKDFGITKQELSGKRRQFGFKVATNAANYEIKAAGVQPMICNTECCSFKAEEYTAGVCGSIQVHQKNLFQRRQCMWRRTFIQSFNVLMSDYAPPA